MIAATLLACASNIAPATLEAVIAVESRGDPLALHVDGLRRQPHPADAAEAARIAGAYIRAGYTVDIGLMQVNSANLPVLGISVSQVLEPCTNIRAGGTILTADYATAAQRWGEGQAALQHALSAYNAGNFYRGFRNGYVARYYGPGGIPVRVDASWRPAPIAAAPREIARDRGTKNGHGPRRPSPAFARARLWTAAMLARFSAPSAVYSNERVPFAVR
ncbi:MAG TPA: lytic transglycosylase domain-containing protein [Stellaceae bacterium]|nr:lytic transglycosylase domain-containing protein [Stellaceae bacterium]